MMEALNEYGRPFHQRATELVVPALSPADVAELLGLTAAEAFDAYLLSGGLPLILDEWPTGAGVWDYLAEAVADPTSALLVSGERAVAAEFPAESQARAVLAAIGSGERSFSLIGRAAGVPQASLSRALELLTAKRVVAATVPLSTRASWLAWRGKAIEPVVREALLRMPERLPPATAAVGGYWTRTSDPEIDLVGADRAPVARRVTFVGSVKWLEQRPFDLADLARLAAHRSQLPGADESTPLLVVSRTGGKVEDLPVLTPAELLAAYPAGTDPRPLATP